MSLYRSFQKLRNISGILIRSRKNYSQDVNKEVIYEELANPDSGIAVIGLNRSKQRNALSVNLVEELNDALDTISASNSVRVVLLRSLVPGIFCAGIYKMYKCL